MNKPSSNVIRDIVRLYVDKDFRRRVVGRISLSAGAL